MSRLVNATIVSDESVFSAIEGEAKEVVFEYRIHHHSLSLRSISLTTKATTRTRMM